MAPPVLMLRFRDLADQQTPDRTVGEHNAIGEGAGGYAWWAWWKKQSEDVPLQLWAEVAKEIASNGSAQAFLVDSGNRKIFSTRILKIEVAVSKEELPAPEGGSKTPAYYSQSKYSTWFKITKIEAASMAVLEQLTFRDKPHDPYVSDAEDLVGRRIGGIEQVLQFSHITYWVARSSISGDRPARTSRLGTRILPAVAPDDVVFAAHPRILHISDPHFSRTQHAFNLDRSGPGASSMSAALRDALRGKEPGLVIVSGDLTWTGSSEEFDLAHASLSNLRRELGLAPDHFVIVPGNHDIRWRRMPDDYQWDGKVEAARNEAIANYVEFFQKWYEVAPTPYLAVGRRFFVSGAGTLDVLGLNSSELQQMEGMFAGLGCVSNAALADAMDRFGWGRPSRTTQVRMVVAHHHVLPVIWRERASDASRGFGVALDAEAQLQRYSEAGVDFVLHGHQHHPFAGYTKRERVVGPPAGPSRPIGVIGCGSTGVKDEHLGPIGRRAFNLIDLRPDGTLSLTCFTTSADRFEFHQEARLDYSSAHGWVRSAGASLASGGDGRA